MIDRYLTQTERHWAGMDSYYLNVEIIVENLAIMSLKKIFPYMNFQRSYNTAKDEETTLKENDYVTGLYNITTTDTLLLFTNLGNYLYLPVYDIPEVKWKELGKHISNIISLSPEEKVINSIPVYNFDEERYITSFTKNGMVKRTLLNEFKVQRYSKPIKMMNLKGTDEVISVTDSTLSPSAKARKPGFPSMKAPTKRSFTQ